MFKVIRSILFVIVATFTILTVVKILSFKYNDGIYSMKIFYEQKQNTVDLLCLGSSHIFEGLNTGILWDEYGISSYIIGGANQPIWNSYYILKEACKYQNPKVVVLDLFSLMINPETVQDSIVIKNTYGMKWSKEKFDAIKTSVSEDRLIEFLFPYFQYHSRYDELGKEDFLEMKGDETYRYWKGFICNTNTEVISNEDVPYMEVRGEIHEKNEKYLREILQFCKDNSIVLLPIIIPYPMYNLVDESVYNTALDICVEYGFPCVDYNLLKNDMGLDYSYCSGDESHLNYIGSSIWTRYFAKKIVEVYELKNHKNDKDYESWEIDSTYLREKIKEQLKKDGVSEDVLYPKK